MTLQNGLSFLLLAACVAPPAADPVDPPGFAAAVGYAADTAVDDTAPPVERDDTASSARMGEAPPLLVVILADDLGANAFWAMRNVHTRLVPASVEFTRAYATVPLCCPVRASFMQGGWYPHQTGVLANQGPNGGAGVFSDGDTLATRLQGAGFKTALVGKYLNGYENDLAPYVPPGWDLFLGNVAVGDFTDGVFVRGSSAPDAAGEGVIEGTDGAYLTTWVFDEALAFLDEHPDEPAFLLLTPQTPHIYATPAAEDLGSWEGYAPRPPSFGEADVSDKPAFIDEVRVDPVMEASWDENAQEMMENLASLDRGVARFLDGLAARGLQDRATIVFTSDNGYLNGEHRLDGKGVAYEESVRVPLVVRVPGVTPRTESGLVAMNLDLPATIADLAGLPPYGEGASLAPALAGDSSALRDHVFLETAFGNHPVWAGVVTERWKYVEWATGEAELYDLQNDPYEQESLHADPPDDADVAALAAQVDAHRALNVTTTAVPAGTLGVPYETTLTAWGGVPPLRWSIASGILPNGLTLSTDGVVSGTPSLRGSYMVQVRVTDSAASPVTGGSATWVEALVFTIGEATRATASREGGDVLFLLPGRSGERAGVHLYLDDTHDTPPLHAAEGVVGDDGFARLRVPGVRADKTWSWSWSIEGRTMRGDFLRAED